GHAQGAARTAADDGAGENGAGGDNQLIQRIAVLGRGVGDEAVVGRVEHGGRHEAVNHYRAHVLVDFILNRRAVGRNSDHYIKIVGKAFSCRDLVEVHVRVS